MGNCQAIDNASIAIQHPNGKVDTLFCPVSVQQIMKLNPGHYVALLLTTTVYKNSSTGVDNNNNNNKNNNNNIPLRVTRIKLLKPTDTLLLGHVYRLVTTKEVMKGLWEKKQARMKQLQQKQQPGFAEKYGNMTTDKDISEFEEIIRKNHVDEKTNQVNKHERRRSRNNNNNNNNTAVVNSSGASKSRGAWQPSLNSISEAAS